MDSRGAFLFILITLYLLASSQVRSPLIDHDKEHQRQIAEEQRALQLLNRSRYGDFDFQADRWLPIPGLRKNDSYFWDLLPRVQERARRDLRSALASAGLRVPGAFQTEDQARSLNLTAISLPVYRNVTGKLRGDWVRQRVQSSSTSALNITALVIENDYVTRDFGLNVTGDTGSLYLELHEGDGEELSHGSSHVREVRANLQVESGSSFGSMWYMSLFGVHFPELGEVILTTTSEKFGGIFSLPHFTLSQDTFDVSHKLLLKSLSDTISEKQTHSPTFFPWSSLPHGSQAMAFPAPKCEYLIYLQQHPVTLRGALVQNTLLQQVEDELRFPVGAPIPAAPLMVMSAVVFSPDCGIILQTKGVPEYPPTEPLYLVGPKQEVYSIYASRLVFAIAGVSIAQISLLLRQIKDASTPSTRSRVSFYTIAMMAMGDAFVFNFILLELFSEISFLILAATAFLGFLSVGYIGMRFMMEIWAVQAPERREQDRLSASQTTNTLQDALPLPATARRATDSGATPIILPPDQDAPDEEGSQPNRGTTPPARREGGTEVGAMYARFYFVLCCLLALSFWSLLWPIRLGAIYAKFLGFIYLSFWTPQIYRNIMRHCRKSLRWDFVIGESILRLFPFVYFFTVRGNVLFIRPDSTTAFTMISWVWIQVWALASQDILGPRFFVPRGWAPPAYDYHPILRETSASMPGDDLESGGMLPISFLRAEERESASSGRDGDRPRPKDNKKNKVFDCAICMQDIEVPILTSAGGMSGNSMTEGATSLLGRRTYMVTPCRHIFHSACLESWMRLRLQCPICRESIPPV
jgi:transmembrane E3 ubiquitin-protein ligase